MMFAIATTQEPARDGSHSARTAAPQADGTKPTAQTNATEETEGTADEVAEPVDAAADGIFKTEQEHPRSVEDLREERLRLLEDRHTRAIAAAEAASLPDFRRELPAGINGETQVCPFGSFLHPALSEAGHPPSEEKQEVLEGVKALLASSWSPPAVIGTGFHIDFAVRDAQIRAVGAPRMVVLSWRQLEALGRIPRSSEGLAVGIPEAIAQVAERYADVGPPGLLQYEDNPFGGASVPPEFWPHLDSELGTNPRLNLVMVSHRWLRPSMDPKLAHPDDEAGFKARLLAHYGRQEAEAPGKRETYFWIDYCSVNQVLRPKRHRCDLRRHPTANYQGRINCVTSF